MVAQTMQVDLGDNIALSVAIEKNARYVAVGCSDADIRIVQMQGDKQGDIIATLKGHDDAVNSLAYNHDNNALYSASTDGTIRIWR